MDIQKNIPLAPYTTFHIGGPADEFVVAPSIDTVVEAVSYAKKQSMPFFVLGSGANILVGDKGIRGLVVKNEAHTFSVNGTQFMVESGAVMSDLIGFTAKKGLSGFEHFAGIPSTVGGALWQNLHFLSPDRTETMYIGDILECAEILNEKGERTTVSKDYFHFGYDKSALHNNRDVVLSATFTLTPKNSEEIEKVIDENLKWREEKHPRDAIHISAGSVFRKIEGHGAGRLIEQVGLKGYKIGGAQISDKHANFILNIGEATAQDVVALIDLIKQKVYDELGFRMETEISLVGEF